MATPGLRRGWNALKVFFFCCNFTDISVVSRIQGFAGKVEVGGPMALQSLPTPFLVPVQTTKRFISLYPLTTQEETAVLRSS